MATAAERAFGTVELFEMIVLPLGVKGILRAQRVCKWWREVIAESKPLQQKLRFEVTSLDPKEAQTMKRATRSWSTDSDSEDDVQEPILINPRIKPLMKNALKPRYAKRAQPFKLKKWLQTNATHRHMNISCPGVRRAYVRVSHKAGPEVYSETEGIRATQRHITIGDLVDTLEPMVKKHERSWGEVWLAEISYAVSKKA
ncbi:uncharacterized protein MYCFIDRAFT_215755 [Pseudocercospora fijiensis CIRAD86]|uniref:F-box domain-containing protein n=1 Tax=Pseudocercospora fijiensis (strain CIRAD86) TaxID=383855 RepID=M2ZP13_PSEFD|nr:uncharacterized protein MYCFIDRAFT_215755 [Pseudocercospora fijiensis CIRAD86]EME80834.1 hypothetical protein MYCFIDRAFT_215755 [Pseudocercospora fijiensis CIRAD86]